MRVVFFLFVYFLGLLSSFLFSNESNLKGIESSFRYGTYQQQLETLGKYNPSSLSGEWGSKYVGLLKIPVEIADDPMVIRKLIQVIYQNKLKQYYNYFEKVLSVDFLEEEMKNRNLYQAEALFAMTEITNQSWSPLVMNYLTNEDLNLNDAGILRNAAKAVGVYKIESLRPKLKEIHGETSDALLKEEIIRSLGAFAKEEDLSFLDDVIFENDSGVVERWIAVVTLKEYKKIPRAFALLRRAYDDQNTDIRARALYAMSFFSDDKVKKMVLKGARDNNPKIRYQAVLGLEQYNGQEINELLEFKAKNDSESSIRKVAIGLLKKRDLWEEEKEDP